MARPSKSEKSGVAQTETTKRETTLTDVKKHLKRVKKAWAVVNEISALKKNEVVQQEFAKAVEHGKNIYRQMIEKQLADLDKDEE